MPEAWIRNINTFIFLSRENMNGVAQPPRKKKTRVSWAREIISKQGKFIAGFSLTIKQRNSKGKYTEINYYIISVKL